MRTDSPAPNRKGFNNSGAGGISGDSQSWGRFVRLGLFLLFAWVLGGWAVFVTLDCARQGEQGVLLMGNNGLVAREHGHLRPESSLMGEQELLRRNEALLAGKGTWNDSDQASLLTLQIATLKSENERLRQQVSDSEAEMIVSRADIARLSREKSSLIENAAATAEEKAAAAAEAAAAAAAADSVFRKEEEEDDGNDSQDDSLYDLVEIRRGTDNKDWRSNSRGNALPLVARPLGMTHWAITNVMNNPWYFNPFKDNFAGIRCTHQPSPWIGDYAFFEMIPTIENSGQQRRASQEKYNANDADLTPGYMKLKLTSQCIGDSCTSIEMAAARHAGLFEVTFPNSVQGQVGISFSNLAQFSGSVGADSVFRGGGHTSKSSVLGIPGTVKHHASVEVTVAGCKAVGLALSGSAVTWTAPNGSPSACIATVRIGTSFISKAQATLNLEQEIASPQTVQGLAREARADWSKYLSRVKVEPDTQQNKDPKDVEELRKMLYTCLWRALLFPRQLGEVNQEGKLVHYSPYDTRGGTYPGPLSTDSGFWDAYRAVYPMLHLVYPELAAQVSLGWVNAIREDPNGMLAQWASPGRVGSMVGSMGEVSMAEAIVNGALTGDDAKRAYQYAKESATKAVNMGREHMSEYMKHGYVPDSHRRDSTVSLSLNYYLSDHAVGLAADFMGEHEVGQMLRERAKSWTNLFDPGTRFFRAKDSSGNFKTPFKPYEWMGPYTEGGPWQYRFYVPHDPQGLRKASQDAVTRSESSIGNMLGGFLENAAGASQLCKDLLEMMTTQGTVSNRNKIHEETEMQVHSFGQYSHNNQPVHHVLYMFAHAGCPKDGQRWIHHTLRSQYGPFGYAGDEDNGEMSSWYILSSLGLYALVPGSGQYQIGAPPLFSKVTIRRHGPRGGKLVIRRDSALPVSKSPKTSFTEAKSVSWNGRRISLEDDAAHLPYKELLQGGELVFRAD